MREAIPMTGPYVPVDQRHHTLRAELAWKEILQPFIDCPYDPDDATRPCLLLDQAPDCRVYVNGSCASGVEHPDLGHAHPDTGCALIQYVEAGGVEAVEWDGPPHILLPLSFVVRWDTDHPVAVAVERTSSRQAT